MDTRWEVRVLHLLQVKVNSYAGTWSRSRREGAGAGFVDSWRRVCAGEHRAPVRANIGRGSEPMAVRGVCKRRRGTGMCNCGEKAARGAVERTRQRARVEVEDGRIVPTVCRNQRASVISYAR